MMSFHRILYLCYFSKVLVKRSSTKDYYKDAILTWIPITVADLYSHLILGILTEIWPWVKWAKIKTNVAASRPWIKTRNTDSETLKRKQQFSTSLRSCYRHTLFYCALLYCASHVLCLLQTESKTLHQQKKNYSSLYCNTHFFLQWSRTKPAMSPRYACVYLY